MPGRIRLLALTHMLANAFLLWLGYYWLSVGESRGSMLAWSASLAILILGLGCWIYGAALAYFGGVDQANAISRLTAAWATALRHLLPLAVAALLVVATYWLLTYLEDHSKQLAFQLASYLTLEIRKPVRPATILRIFEIAWWIVRWIVLPVLLLPMFAALARSGWIGFKSFGALRRSWLFWMEAPLLFLCILRAPMWILSWIPHVDNFWLQFVSLALRGAGAYLLFAAAWLILAFVTSGGTPRFTQSSTVASP
jgi:hypothetical protein